MFRKIFIGGLSGSTNEEKLSKYFSKFGQIDDSTIMREKDTGTFVNLQGGAEDLDLSYLAIQTHVMMQCNLQFIQSMVKELSANTHFQKRTKRKRRKPRK